jgi:hypothetical protein
LKKASREGKRSKTKKKKKKRILGRNGKRTGTIRKQMI